MGELVYWVEVDVGQGPHGADQLTVAPQLAAVRRELPRRRSHRLLVHRAQLRPRPRPERTGRADARVDRTRAAERHRHDPLSAPARACARRLPRPHPARCTATAAAGSSRACARPARSRSTTNGRSRSITAVASSAGSALLPIPERFAFGARLRDGCAPTCGPGRRRAAGRGARRAPGDPGRPNAHAQALDPHPPRRRGLGRWRGMGDPGARQPLLRHPAPRLLLHRSPPGTPTSFWSAAASPRRCASRSAEPGRRCRSRKRSSPPERMPARAASRKPIGSTAGGVDRVLPVDVYVPGSPPSPITLLHGLLLATGLLTREAAA